MTDLLSLVGVLLGMLLLLIGLVMIASQVRVHQIEVYSAGSWVFRAGALLSIAGLLVSKTAGGPAELAKVGWLTGGAALLGGLFVLNHERAQVLHDGSSRWDWPRSLTAQMIALGSLILIIALVN